MPKNMCRHPIGELVTDGPHIRVAGEAQKNRSTSPSCLPSGALLRVTTGYSVEEQVGDHVGKLAPSRLSHLDDPGRAGAQV